MNRVASRLASSRPVRTRLRIIFMADRTAARRWPDGRVRGTVLHGARSIATFMYTHHYRWNVFVGHVRRPADFWPGLHRAPVVGHPRRRSARCPTTRRFCIRPNPTVLSTGHSDQTNIVNICKRALITRSRVFRPEFARSCQRSPRRTGSHLAERPSDIRDGVRRSFPRSVEARSLRARTDRTGPWGARAEPAGQRARIDAC